MALLPWQKANIVQITQLTHNTRSFIFQFSGPGLFDFKPGQFVTIDLPIDEKPNKRWRSYSIASWPNGNNSFELCIVLNKEGKGTPYLFDEVKEGAELTLRGPVGVFTLPENIDKDVFLICTGTGIAPFRSMVHHIFNHNIPHKKIYLVFGCRKYEDALYADELKALAEKHPSLQFHSVFSRENVEENLDFTHKGYVHKVYESIVQSNKANSNQPIPATFYLCGWKQMVDEAKQRIMSLGYDRKSIHQELYG
ncbi:MAG TPA: FAD-dependent oxidoreductase [Ferruginibacter sp.]|nr:FAD-dependent oxidoreductase [Chitinophagaceae bacterium]MBP6371613.1 FAD-dependent oxidoreductase [Ferruginibacter sp.]HPA22838.1 FAD-dependent oxidoreductase [Ferruginibacter sp.]